MYKRILLSLAVIGALSQASAVTFNYVVSKVYNGSVSKDNTFTGTTIPALIELEATLSPGYYSKTQVDYTDSGSEVTFETSFNHKRFGYPEGYSQSRGILQFTVASDTTYELSGNYNVDHGRGVSGRTVLRSYLGDATGSTYWVNSEQESKSTGNESFVLGGSGGDEFNYFSGSLSGALVPGQTYEFSFEALTEAHHPDDDTGATASGMVTLKIGGGAPEEDDRAVPDSGATAVLMGLALLGLAAARRRMTT